ncbi:MAG: hypothetical protein IPG17_17370 [Sandaracinaceae bacterium]|jgi:hypothetical protein|nr:hypothetical protein [Sandaracinaceae bacterium]
MAALGFTLLIAGMALHPARAFADLGTLEVHSGVLRLERAGEAVWRPVVRGGFAAELIGPLHMGAYVQLTGYDLPLRSPQPGGGVYFSVRPRLPELRLRPAVDASFGRLRLPLEGLDGQPRGQYERTFVVSVAGSVGISVSPAVTLEARVEYSHYFATEAGSQLDSGAIAMLAGMTIHIP